MKQSVVILECEDNIAYRCIPTSQIKYVDHAHDGSNFYVFLTTIQGETYKAKGYFSEVISAITHSGEVVRLKQIPENEELKSIDMINKGVLSINKAFR